MPLQRPLHDSDVDRRQTSSRFGERRSVLASAWACHFALSIAIIAWGFSRYEEDRKYIPIDANSVEGRCSKAYANVLASSIAEDGAIVCCTQENSDGICQSLPRYLFLAQRLTRFPEVFLLPLFPLLVRGLLQFSKRRRPKYGSNDTDGNVLKRFFLYIGLIFFRFGVLYILLDKIENLVVQPSGDGCWYDGLLRKHQDTCYGKDTDFSDHIVLFFSQMLPIALTEVLFSFVAPYWRDQMFLPKLVPTTLVACLLYLYLVTFLAAYKTAAYFHTRFETSVGYLISLSIQIPLFLVTSTSHMEPIRDYFFGCGRSDRDKKP